MSTTTELLLFQAAATPTGASALGIPASETDYEAFAETLKTELGYGQGGTKTGNSLPQKGQSAPNDAASVAKEKEPASGSPAGLATNQSRGTTRDGGVKDPNNAQLAAREGALHRKSSPDAMGGSALGDASSDTDVISAGALTPEDASARLTEGGEFIAALAFNNAGFGRISDGSNKPLDNLAGPTGWTEAELSGRLAAVEQMFAERGRSGTVNITDSEVPQLLARSSLPLDVIEQRLAQLAQAGMFEGKSGFQQGDVGATALIQLVTAQFEEIAMSDSAAKTAIDSNTVTAGRLARPNLIDTAQISPHTTADVSKAAGSPEVNSVVASTSGASARLDAIWNMMASSGQGVISGTIAADLHQMLANSDEGLDVIQARLQALAKEGVGFFNKETYFGSPRLGGSALTAGQVSSNAAVRSLADQALADPIRAGQAVAKGENAQGSRLSAPVGGLQGIEMDPRRAATILTDSQTQQPAVKSDAASVNVGLRSPNPMIDEVTQALVAAKQGDAARAARESAGSPLSDRNTAVTLSPAQMAAQGRSVAPPPVSDLSSKPKIDSLSTARVRMASNMNSQPVESSTTATTATTAATATATATARATTATTAAPDTVKLAEGQAAIQDSRMDARLSQDLSVNRSISFELPSSSQPTVASTGSVAAPGVAASATLSTTPNFRTTAEAPMQNTPWSPQFSEELGERVRVFVNNGMQEARLQLTPADLGRVQITINTEGDHARVVFVAETAVARDLLDQSMPRLREMLQQSGIQLAQGDVSDQAESQARGERLQADAEGGARSDADGQAAEAEHASIIADKPAEEGRVDTYI